jgi:heme A synthase
MTPVLLMIIGAITLAIIVIVAGINFILFINKGHPSKAFFIVHVVCIFGCMLGGLTAVSGLVWFLLVRFG